MKFLANENFPLKSHQILKNNGWDIEHIAKSNMGISDEEVIAYSKQEDRIIITFDSDYGELVYKKSYKPNGVIYLRFKSFRPEFPAELLLELMSNESLIFESKFTVIDENQIRQREI